MDVPPPPPEPGPPAAALTGAPGGRTGLPAGQVPVEDYAVLGDGHTAALVSRRGSVDWMCLPRFDSDACFAALLGTPEHGRWLLTVRDATEVTRRSRGDSFVLVTTYGTARGAAVVTEAMPHSRSHPVCCCATAPSARTTACTAGRRRSWRARSGWPTRSPARTTSRG